MKFPSDSDNNKLMFSPELLQLALHYPWSAVKKNWNPTNDFQIKIVSLFSEIHYTRDILFSEIHFRPAYRFIVASRCSFNLSKSFVKLYLYNFGLIECLYTKTRYEARLGNQVFQACT